MGFAGLRGLPGFRVQGASLRFMASGIPVDP